MQQPRTNNKIVLCQWCYGVLTPNQHQTCGYFCTKKRAEFQADRPEREKIWVYMNKNMLDLALGNKARPHEFSYFIYTGHELVCVATFDKGDLDAIGSQECNAYDAWWREVGALNVSIEPHQPRVMREEGLRSYLCDRFEISTEKNVACAIGDITRIEGFKSPLELFNSL